MAELILMRQRIKAIETIKKVTYAMRIVSMANHNQLRLKKNPLYNFNSAIHLLWQKIATKASQQEKFATDNRVLSIIVGAQKGLCGNFTANILSFFAKKTEPVSNDLMDIIVVGKKAIEGLQEYKNQSFILKFKLFNNKSINTIAEEITRYIVDHQELYTSVVIYFNNSKTFFHQKAESINLYPLDEKKTIAEQTSKEEDHYSWPQDDQSINALFTKIIIRNKVYEALLNSLIAEHAARFLAMDNSTKNASNLLESMKLAYNKTRQTNITRELTDLISGL